MENIFEPTGNFDFSNISLAHPVGINGGAYFTKIQMNNKPLYIEAPKCLTKQGFVKSGKKIYSDLMFDNNDEQFIRWMENLETTCQQLIYEKGESWFQNKLEMNDIETAFTSPMRIYKSGKFYLIRVNVKMNYITNSPVLKLYNESETPLSIDDVTPETNIISIVEVQGIKFTSRNFQIELELKQVMIINTNEIFENCLIKTSSSINHKISTDNTFIANKLNFKIMPPSLQIPSIDPQQTPIPSLESNDNNVEDVEDVEDVIGTVDNMSLLEKISNTIINDKEQNSSVNISEVSSTLLEPQLTTNTVNINNDSLGEKELMEDIEEVDMDSLLDSQNELTEIVINPSLDSLETMTLKKPNQVYYEIYKEARKKAKAAKKTAIVAFLEAKNIKKTYMLDDLDESDSDSDSDNGSYNDSDNNNDSDNESDNSSDTEEKSNNI